MTSKKTNQDINNILQKLNEKKFIFHWDSSTKSISFFDNVEYERNDYEVICPKTRSQLEEFFKENDYTLGPKGQFKKNNENRVIFTLSHHLDSNVRNHQLHNNSQPKKYFTSLH